MDLRGGNVDFIGDTAEAPLMRIKIF